MMREYTPHAFVMYCVQNYSQVLWDTIYFSPVTKNHMLLSARALFQQDNDPWHTCKEHFSTFFLMNNKQQQQQQKSSICLCIAFWNAKNNSLQIFHGNLWEIFFWVTQKTFSPHYCIFFCFSSWILLERTCMINYPSVTTPTTKKQHI